MDRRSFISAIGISSGGLALACSGLSRRAETFAATGNFSSLRSHGYGELIPTASKNTGETFLALPKGFEYNVIGKVGAPLADGRTTPPLHDGMATFKVKNELRIVRNHEVVGGKVPRPGSAMAKENHYDETAGGGTTTLIIDPRTRQIVRDFVSLSGTLINCAGGPTPWGSWISCEETVLGQTVVTDSKGNKFGGFPKPHGYCFEVPASANTNVTPVPLKAMGRFVHEAIAVDNRGIVYLTEDLNPGGFYRFLPKRNKRLGEGGVLQMLAVKGSGQYDTRRGQKQNVILDATWVTIDDPDPASADVDNQSVSKQGRAKGAAIFARLEGCCTDADGRIYFTSTSGGDNGGGQIWRYDHVNRDEGRLTMLFESPSRDVLDMPDNITVMPKSRLVFVCEDSDYVGAGGTSENFLRILTPEGRMADFAKNIVPKFERGEFAGVTFSPDGSTVFFNIQQIGATFAVWGDWSKFQA
ncbi:MAG TPA: alkaline phosphatase PhoX [Pyrinomonadaceae bacterium]|nr:alkaline phosphatase PhoX [Pyrinomonadaceae bacterium]